MIATADQYCPICFCLHCSVWAGNLSWALRDPTLQLAYVSLPPCAPEFNSLQLHLCFHRLPSPEHRSSVLRASHTTAVSRARVGPVLRASHIVKTPKLYDACLSATQNKWNTGRVEAYRSWVMFSGCRIIEELSSLAAVLLTTVTSPSKRGVEKSYKHLENDCPSALVKEQTVHIRLQNQLTPERGILKNSFVVYIGKYII